MKYFGIFLLFLLPYLGHSQTEAELLYHWTDNSLPVNQWLNLRYNETWGFELNGREYGVVGTTDGMRIFDLTDPSNVPTPFTVLAPAIGPQIIHRDMKDYKGYLYAVCDEDGASTLQIVDCNNLPASVNVVYNSNEFVVTAHNLFIDTAQAKLYLLGAGGATKILDVSNPVQPTLLGSYPNASYQMPYVHDAYIHNNIGIMNCGNDGLWIIDFSNPALPVTLGTMTNYPGAGYNHSGWMSDDGRYYFLCDETHGSPVKTIDIESFTDMNVISSMNPSSFPNQIPHNALIKKNLLYVSYYYDGLQVFDISDALNPKRVTYYDTYNGANQAGFAGSWGVNPNLPSGNTLLSDLNTGFYVFGPTPEPADFQLRSNHPFLMICEGEDAEIELTVGSSFSSNAMAPSITGLPVGANGVMPLTVAAGQKFISKISNLGSGNHVVKWNVSDGTKTGVALAHVFVKPEMAAPNLVQPVNGAINQVATPLIKWETVSGASNYFVELSTAGGADFDQNVFYSTTKTGTLVQLNSSAGLQNNTTYYWRVSVKNFCGPSYSEIFSFTVRPLVNTVDLGENKVNIFPSPAVDYLTVDFEQAIQGDTNIELWNLAGQKVYSTILTGGNNRATLLIKDLPEGSYILVLKNGTQVGKTTVVVGK